MQIKMKKIPVIGVIQIICAAIFFYIGIVCAKDMRVQIPDCIEVTQLKNNELTMKDLETLAIQHGLVAGGRGEEQYIEGKWVYYQPVTENYVTQNETLALRMGRIHTPIVWGIGDYSEEIPVEFIRIPLRDGIPPEENIQTVSVQLQASLDGTARNYRNMHELSDALLELGFFGVSAWFVLAFCILAYRKIVEAYEGKRSMLVVGVLLFGIACIVFAMSLQWLQIPRVYLPAENIFDVKHYLNLIVESVQHMNESKLAIDYAKSAAVYLLMESSALFVGILLFWQGAFRIVRVCGDFGFSVKHSSKNSQIRHI